MRFAAAERDITSFVPKANPDRPNGDYKYGPSPTITPGSGINQPIWEEGWNPSLRNNANPSAADFYTAIGYSEEWNFDNSNKNGVGPFRLDVGESITIVWVGAAGFRFERGESIHTENSYKYSAEGFRALAARAGYAGKKLWTDRKGLFALHGLTAV